MTDADWYVHRRSAKIAHAYPEQRRRGTRIALCGLEMWVYSVPADAVTSTGQLTKRCPKCVKARAALSARGPGGGK